MKYSRIHGFLSYSPCMEGRKFKRKAFKSSLDGISSTQELQMDLRKDIIENSDESEEIKIIASIIYSGLETEDFTGKLLPGFPEELFERAVLFLEQHLEES